MSKSQQSNTYSVMLSPIAGATTARTASLDCRGADYASILINVGIELNTNSTNVVCSLTESDDNSTWVTFDSNFTSITVDNTAATMAVWNVNRTGGRKRYLKLAVTPDTTTNGTVLTSAIGVLNPERHSASLATNQIVG